MLKVYCSLIKEYIDMDEYFEVGILILLLPFVMVLYLVMLPFYLLGYLISFLFKRVKK